MAIRFKYEAGKTAVYKTDNGDAPLTAPLSNLPLLKFHSDLAYPRVIQEVTTTVNFPARSNFQDVDATYTLFAHGKAGFPFVFGKVSVGGTPVNFVGTIPIQQGHVTGFLTSAGYYGRFISLGADATNVYVYEYCVAAYTNNVAYEAYDAISVPVTVYVTDELL